MASGTVTVSVGRLRGGILSKAEAIGVIADTLGDIGNMRIAQNVLPEECRTAADDLDCDLRYLAEALAENPDAERFRVVRDEGDESSGEAALRWLSLGRAFTCGPDNDVAEGLAEIVAFLRAEDAKRLGREAA